MHGYAKFETGRQSTFAPNVGAATDDGSGSFLPPQEGLADEHFSLSHMDVNAHVVAEGNIDTDEDVYIN